MAVQPSSRLARRPWLAACWRDYQADQQRIRP